MTKPQTIAFAALCLLTSATWLLAQALPSDLPTFQSQSFHFLLLALATSIYCLTQKQTVPPIKTLLTQAIPGLALFAAPIILLQKAQGMVSSSLNVAVFALLPVVIVVAQGQIRWLVPALAGAAGILLILPFSLPAIPSAYLGLALVIAAMALTAGAILAFHRRPPDAWSTATIFLAAALLLAIISPAHAPWTITTAATEALRTLLIDAPEIFLLLWLIPRLDPRRLSARWLLAPALTILEGYALMRPSLSARLIIGLALLAIGGAILFAAPDEKPDALRLTGDV